MLSTVETGTQSVLESIPTRERGNEMKLQYSVSLQQTVFPVHYPVLAPERAEDGLTTHQAETFKFRSAGTGSTFPVFYPMLAPQRAGDGRLWTR